uniref:VWFA domain-containing protein n=1 Tax=Acrobeloides nanus TaxID=290746 RepID=A0A914EAJ7_9BILA
MGSSIIIVGLNQTNPPWLQELSNTVYFFNFNDSVVNLTQFLLNHVCTFDLTTPAPQTTPAPSSNPLSDEIGTTCANDPSNLWLDIIVAIDNTSSMGSGVSNVANHQFKIIVMVVFRLQRH